MRLSITNEPADEPVQVTDATSYPVEVDATEEPIDREGWAEQPFGFSKRGTA